MPQAQIVAYVLRRHMIELGAEIVLSEEKRVARGRRWLHPFATPFVGRTLRHNTSHSENERDTVLAWLI